MCVCDATFLQCFETDVWFGGLINCMAYMVILVLLIQRYTDECLNLGHILPVTANKIEVKY